MTRPRLWPAVLVLLLGAAWIAKTWLVGDAIRQVRTIQTIATVVLVAVALLLWLAAFSRLPWRTRLGGVVAALGLVALLSTLFRVRGVTGDLVPIVEPRFGRAAAPPEPPSPQPEPTMEPSAAPTSSASEPAPSPSPTAAVPAPEAPGPATAQGPPADAPAFPQFLGPSRDGRLDGPRLARGWSARPPRKLWRQPVGAGWAGFAIAGGIAVTQEQRGDEERVVAYELASGRPLWSHADRARYATVIAGVGPRAVPTIAASRVYTLGATGLLNALELSTGRKLWSHDVLAENAARLPDWGRSSSPLVVDGRVVVIAGGNDGRRLVAYDAESGAPAWAAGEGGASYSSPTLLDLAGRPQLVVLNTGSVSGHDPLTGAVLWEQPFPHEQPNVAMPLRLGPEQLLVSVGYGVGSKAYRVSERGGELAVSLEWESPRLKSKFANLLLHDGFVYGLDDGVLTCIDPASGERRWKSGRYGHGQLLLVGGLLLLQSEEGELVLIEPSPEGLRELASFPALDGKTWNPPALAGPLLAVRNDREAAVYELPVDRE